MLGKMIKYDLRFGAKKYAFMAALTAALILTACTARILDNDAMLIIAIVFASMATVAFGILYVVISIQHLYSQLCGRESYLSYSLPVSTHTLLLSKLICILFWGVVTSLLIIVYWLVGVEFMFLRPEGESLIALWRQFVVLITADEQRIFYSMFPLFTICFVVLMLNQVSHYAFCVSLINIPALKERGIGVVTGVLTYIIGGQLVGLLQIFIYWLIERVRSPGASFMQIGTFEELQYFLIVFTLLAALTTVAYYGFSVYFIERKRSI